jgi:3-methyladenine DNA glycosylase AlkD
MDAHELAAEIVAGLCALTDRTTGSVRTFRRGYSKRLGKEAPRVVLDTALLLLREPEFVHRFVAYELITYHRAALNSLSTRDLIRLGRGINRWESVDTFACYLSGRVWREKQVPDRLIHAWARSPDRWWRRAALVSTVPLNNKDQGGNGDAKRTLAVCRLLVSDPDDMVVKALSWALRELAKRDPVAVRRFVAEHEKALAKRVVREVRNKLTTGLKNPRAGSKSHGS